MRGRDIVYEPILQIIYGDVKNVIEQQKYNFESFWSRSIVAE
jgi:hypothetical protein